MRHEQVGGSAGPAATEDVNVIAARSGDVRAVVASSCRMLRC
jgi:hypothetical protein